MYCRDKSRNEENNPQTITKVWVKHDGDFNKVRVLEIEGKIDGDEVYFGEGIDRTC